MAGQAGGAADEPDWLAEMVARLKERPAGELRLGRRLPLRARFHAPRC